MDKKQFTNIRIIGVWIIIVGLFLVLILKTFYIQYAQSPILNERANDIYHTSYKLEPERGAIFDRNYDKLAYNGKTYTVIATLSEGNSNHISDPAKVANMLSQILDMEEYELFTLLTKDVYQVELRPGGWKINQDTADKIRDLDIEGIILKEDRKRYYPFNTLAAYVLGFVNYDNEPILGIESYYNETLLGTSGELKVMEDSKGYELPDGEIKFEPAINGNNVILTIDKTIQQYIESALDEAEEKYNPKGMVVIAADPNTGEILGMSSRPNYNPNEYWNIDDYKNYAVSYNFEPGSTFKVITLASAIEEGLFNRNETFMSGTVDVPGGTIKDANNGYGWGEITYLEGVERSSNVAFVKLGYEKLGEDLLFSYIEEFGFGEKTGIDLPNESTGIMRESKDAYPLDVAAISFGQGVAVTPIQQVMAVSAVANGGYLITPHIVKEIRDSNTDELIDLKEPDIKRQVISEATSRETSAILEEVVCFGQMPGYIEGYHIAGKTGTAQKVGTNGKYQDDKYIVSYIGYAPSDNPELLIYVVVDEPDLNIPYYGSTIAAPIFTDIMQNSLRYLKVPKDDNSDAVDNNKSAIYLKNYVDNITVDCESELTALNLKPIIIGDGEKVIKQYPEQGESIVEDSQVFLITVPKDGYQIPNFIGKSMREAFDFCNVLGIEVVFEGNGVVVEQNINEGLHYNGEELILTLKDPSTISD